MNTTEVHYLSPAELEMIKLKREQEELAKKELEAKKALQIEKDIAAAELQLAKTMKEDEEQVAATVKYLEELVNCSPQYVIEIVDSQNVIEVKGDYINPDNPKEANYNRVVVWSKTYPRKVAHINYGNYKVRVAKHFTYKSYRSVDNGYKMFISGDGIDYNRNNRPYAKAKTVHEVFTDAIKSIQEKKELQEKKKNALSTTFEKMKLLYPNAKIVEGYDFEKNYNPRKYGYGERYDTITITLPNNITITYRVYSDGSLSRKSISFPSNGPDQWKILEKLNSITFD